MTADPGKRTRGRPRTGVREALVAGAQEVLTESGVARLSTKEVAARAGVAESSIFYHFGDRMGLLQAVIQHHLQPLKDMVAERDRPRDADLRAELRTLLEAFEEFFHLALPVLAAVGSDAGLRAVYQQRSQDLDLGPHRAIEVVQARLSGHAAPDADLRPFALLLIGAAHQRALQRQLSPPSALITLPSSAALADALLPAFPR
ncbi:TetR/AcrR family transcriptional regulator [Nocardia sp. alder85J]|uniref:TetR/AcrR family transcriptional regulator n=1 Tax=Nocardia sp. alder85J TaxID=2862949 RepID=UPI001CD1E224|nr:TetR/AcrR family transcriptional regulator [Nocardia sp. alder85J]MCX4092833.1 TetR/AcrR family transcriptional regulator [Nocardia sp. alder85J]